MFRQEELFHTSPPSTFVGYLSHQTSPFIVALDLPLVLTLNIRTCFGFDILQNIVFLFLKKLNKSKCGGKAVVCNCVSNRD